jgi:hypothetical protein
MAGGPAKVSSECQQADAPAFTEHMSSPRGQAAATSNRKGRFIASAPQGCAHELLSQSLLTGTCWPAWAGAGLTSCRALHHQVFHTSSHCVT